LSNVVPGKREVVINSEIPVCCLIIRLISVDLPTLVTPTTYTSLPLRYLSINSNKLSISYLLLALVSATSIGLKPCLLASLRNQSLIRERFKDLGNKSDLLPTNKTSFLPTNLCSPGITDPLKSNISTTLTINESDSPI